MNIKFLPVAFAILMLSIALFSGRVAPPKDVVPPAETVTGGEEGPLPAPQIVMRVRQTRE